MGPIDLYVPSWFDLAGWAGVVFACVVLMGFGRLLTAGRATPEAALVGGWGGAVFILTLWGVVTPMSLRVPALGIVALGLVSQIVPGLRLGRSEWRAVIRILVLASPLLVLMASARPSLPDTWLNLLPNAAYIYDHGFFPADARPAAHSFIAGAPYNMQLAAFIAGLVTPGFPFSAMIDLNLLLQLGAALLLARLATGNEIDTPSWGMSALGMLCAMAFNPGFVPRYHLSAYSEPSVTVTVAFAGWFAARALDRLNGHRDARLDLWLLALTLTALVNIKQESIMLAASLLVAAAALILVAAVDKGRALLALTLAAIPAAVLYLVWRWYVLAHFEIGELKNLPLAEWHVFELPLILWNMLRAVGGRIFLFLCIAGVAAIAVRRLAWREYDLGTRLVGMLAGVTIAYNAALVFAYVAHFEGEMGIGAHSYFRYNTHLGLLLMAAFVLVARSWTWPRFSARWQRAAPIALVLAALLAPFPFLRMLRFDLEVPNLRVWSLGHQAASQIASNEQILLILPGEGGSIAPALEGVLRYTPPRRPDVEFGVVDDWNAALAMKDYRRALLSCAPAGIDGVPKGSAALLERVTAGWRPQVIWPYDPVPSHARWSQVLAPPALCLGG